MTNLVIDNSKELYETIKDLIPSFASIVDLSDSFLKTQAISKQLFYTNCEPIINEIYLQSIQYRIEIKDKINEEDDDDFTLLFKFIGDFN